MKLRRHLPLAVAIFGFLALLFSACVPPSAVNPDGSVKAPKTISNNLLTQGFSEFENYKKKYPRSNNSAYTSQLNRVANRLTKVIEMPQAKWEFIVFENKTPNAFALPGGKVGVNSGMFQVTQTEAGLAAVVGHEIAHVTLNHANARIKRASAAAIGGVLLDQLLQSQGASSGNRAAAASIYGTGSALGAILPFSREQELQADRIGSIYMSKAGYHPLGAVSLWQRFKAYKDKSGSSETPQFLSTHPLDTKRIDQLQAFLPVAMKSYKN